MTILERRAESTPRVALDVPIHLVHEGFNALYQASLRNLTLGGFSVRSSLASAAGTRLRFEIDPLDGDRPVAGICRVAWSHGSHGQGADLGLTFESLEAGSDARLEGIVESLDEVQPGDVPGAQSVRGRVWLGPVDEDDSCVEICQVRHALPLRKSPDHPGFWEDAAGRRGRIEDWCLVFEGAEPTVQLRFVVPVSGQTQPPPAAHDALAELDAEDTLPDSETPLAFSGIADRDDDEAFDDAGLEDAPFEDEGIDEDDAWVALEAPAEAAPTKQPSPPALTATALDVLRRLRTLLTTVLTQGAAWVQAFLAPRQKARRGQRSLAKTMTLRLGKRAQRRATKPPRRAQSAPARGRTPARKPVRKPANLVSRTFVVSAAVVGLLALGLVWMMGSQDDAAFERALANADAQTDEASAAGGDVAQPGETPADSPYAVEAQPAPKPVSVAKSAPPAADSTPVAEGAPEHLFFGDKSLGASRAFFVRMSRPIEALEGAAEEGGFRVETKASLALDRAAPIADGHPLVERAMILNRGDRAELTVHFRGGKKVPYAVVARGAVLEVRIGEAG